MSDILSWDKAVDKKVKSSDDQDLGKIESITREYIQAKQGLIGKKYYFIPKYYIQGYDGDNLWVSLTKDEVKTRFERETPPDLKEFETSEYAERKSMVIKQYSDFDRSIPAYNSSSKEDEPTLPAKTPSNIRTKAAHKKNVVVVSPSPAKKPRDDESLSARVKKVGRSFKDKVKSLGKKKPKL
jgi:hypothetical protein